LILFYVEKLAALSARHSNLASHTSRSLIKVKLGLFVQFVYNADIAFVVPHPY
jgi:hypothetical protein